MGCGAHIKVTNDQVQKPTPRPQAPVIQPKDARPHNTHNKLDPEVLDGFGKILRAFYIQLAMKPKPASKSISPLTHQPINEFPESNKPPPADEHKPVTVSNPFQDLLKTEQARVEHDRGMEPKRAFEDGGLGSNEDKRYSPEPPRPDSVSDEEESRYENEDMKNARMEKERLGREEAEHRAAAEREESEKLAASQKGKMIAMTNEADSIVSKYQS